MALVNYAPVFPPGSNKEDSSKDIDPSHLQFRYFYLNDGVRQRRDEWVEQVFPGAVRYVLADDDTSGLSRSRDDFDGVVVGGNDVPRMARFVRINRKALAGVVKVCVLVGGNAQKRAQALMAGFDDVLDAQKMRPEEASARIEAIARRYRMAIEFNKERDRIEREMRQIAEVDRLTSRERMLLEAFLHSSAQFLTYRRMQSLLSSYLDEITYENVKVIICNMRKKLRPGNRIRARTGLGYALERAG